MNNVINEWIVKYWLQKFPIGDFSLENMGDRSGGGIINTALSENVHKFQCIDWNWFKQFYEQLARKKKKIK